MEIHGEPFSQPTFTKFEIWLMDLGILTIHGRIHHPQTQGKEERYNRSMTRELLKQTTFKDFDDAWKKCAEYRRLYNEKDLIAH